MFYFVDRNADKSSQLDETFSHKSILADVNKQKQQSETHFYAVGKKWVWLSADNTTNKSEANVNKDFIWVTIGFPPGIWPKLNWWAASQGKASPTAHAIDF